MARRHSSLASDSHGVLVEEEEEEDGEGEKRAKGRRSDESAEEAGEGEGYSRRENGDMEEDEEEIDDDESSKSAAARRYSERSGSNRSEMSGCHGPSGGETDGPSGVKKQVRLSLPNGPYVPRYPMLTSPSPLTGSGYFRRRTAVTLSDYKSCALVQSNMKMGLGDLM